MIVTLKEIKRWTIAVMILLSGIALLWLPIRHSAIQHSASGISNSHKLHVSVTQVEFNQKAQSVEIVIRVFGDDLESALSQYAKRRVKLDPDTANKDKQVGELAIAYLRNSFQLKNKAGRPVKLNWLRLEWQSDMFWLYIEGKLPANSVGAKSATVESLEGVQLRNKVFHELFEDQVNIVNAKIQNKQIGFMFDSKDEFKTFTEGVSSKTK